MSSLPQGLDPRSFDALHDAPAQWQPAMDALVRELGWTGDWRAAGEGTVLVALLVSDGPQARAAPGPPPEGPATLGRPCGFWWASAQALPALPARPLGF
jgi:hypothetical protein